MSAKNAANTLNPIGNINVDWYDGRSDSNDTWPLLFT
jgi:hypothetical protein